MSEASKVEFRDSGVYLEGRKIEGGDTLLCRGALVTVIDLDHGDAEHPVYVRGDGHVAVRRSWLACDSDGHPDGWGWPEVAPTTTVTVTRNGAPLPAPEPAPALDLFGHPIKPDTRTAREKFEEEIDRLERSILWGLEQDDKRGLISAVRAIGELAALAKRGPQ